MISSWKIKYNAISTITVETEDLQNLRELMKDQTFLKCHEKT